MKVNKYGHCLEEFSENKNYSEIFYKRATGEYPEMEVSKAMANVLKKFVNNNDKIADIGCGCGHFYRSLKKRIKKFFFYYGLDPYDLYLKKAKKAWRNDKNVTFKKGNILKIPFKKKEFEIVYSSNVLVHIPQSEIALRELMRITKKKLILRTVVFDYSYKIQLVYNKNWWPYTKVKPENEFDKKGNPRSFAYYNILSFDYLRSVIKKINKNASIEFIKDNFYSKKKIVNSLKKEKREVPTNIIAGQQVSGAILQPHYFVIISIN
jgi:ubiquinone/menaquinone biosynthesis C-methylase UbiE